jgi:hypothetical protein
MVLMLSLRIVLWTLRSGERRTLFHGKARTTSRICRTTTITISIITTPSLPLDLGPRSLDKYK